ncbi:MAG: O-antigen ligase family protein [Clostridia bacterium]|nr:O-antigen ligase family protein [Clostridia bacterium]
MAKKLTKNHFNLLDGIFLLAPFFYGILPIWSCCLLGLICCIGIIYKYNKEKRLQFPKGIQIYLVVLYLISFIITEFVAIDKGMNLLAFIKNISILLFIILLAQFEENEEERNRHLYMISISSTISVAISLLLILVPVQDIFFNARLQGLFFYANSYGLFLLVGALVLFLKKERNWYDYLMLAILFIGIVLTNSRAIILMTLIFSIVTLFFNKEQIRSSIIAIICFIITFVGGYFIFNMEKRVSTEMLGSSEFISRIIYYQDAAKMITNHPLGLGYEGFWYEQAKEQTAIYDSKFVHSSIIQICLDVGIIPAITLITLVAMTFFSKNQNAFSRIIIFAILLHSLIDFDLEYLYFILIIALFIDYEKIVISSKKLVFAIFIPIACVMAWIFLGDALYYAKNYEWATRIIPFHSDALQEMLYSTTSEEKQLEYANKVITINKNVSGAYEALRNKALEDNEFEKAIEYEEQRLALNKYKIKNYLEYASLLSKAIEYYYEKQENEMIRIYFEKVIQIEDGINETLDLTNPLCYKTIHTPELDIPSNLKNYIENAKSWLNN